MYDFSNIVRCTHRFDAIEEQGLIMAIQAAHKAREAAARMQELADLDKDVAAHLGARMAPSSLQNGTASLVGEVFDARRIYCIRIWIGLFVVLL
jgi:hypothetical protein